MSNFINLPIGIDHKWIIININNLVSITVDKSFKEEYSTNVYTCTVRSVVGSQEVEQVLTLNQASYAILQNQLNPDNKLD